MSGFDDFAMTTPRPLPVFVLADTSGSMKENGNIEVLNNALTSMIRAFGEEDSQRAAIFVSIITFGGAEAKIHTPLLPAEEVQFDPLEARGRTPMGGAFSKVRSQIEDRQVVDGRAYRPSIVLVSDGKPTDEWENPLKELMESGRASKAFRLAMGIGQDADEIILGRFQGPDRSVFTARESNDIIRFFKFVTMSVTSRSVSTNPNEDQMIELPDPADFEF